ncbi:alcohol dehydrogenase small subunit [Komagataeibacter saccharivorans NRIC 0614]|nr:alcohol dehydrogenase small subunit [Komagataeibacter saccharivorans NRIC 0614]
MNMTSFSRFLSAGAFATLLAAAPLAANAETSPPTGAGVANQVEQIKPGSLSADTVFSAVASAKPADLGGILNYCIQSNYLSSAEAWPVLAALNKKTNDVPSNSKGNMSYADGSTGLLKVGGAEPISLEDASTTIRQQACAKVEARAKSML